ncbi:MAG: adenylate kinase [Vulcanimicrobiaceae bacterium]
MRAIFLGPPGAGKGTQAQILESKFGVKQISTGDILRENRAKGTDLGKQAEGFMQRGELVPDDLVIKMIENVLDANGTAGFIMDGFPRTVAQAQALDALLDAKKLGLDAVVLFSADRPTLMTRLTSRWTNPRSGKIYNTITNPPKAAGIDDEDGGPLVQREDDKPETVAKRLDVYDAQTAPLVEYYRNTGKLVEVDGLAPIETVTRQILDKVGTVNAR